MTIVPASIVYYLATYQKTLQFAFTVIQSDTETGTGFEVTIQKATNGKYVIKEMSEFMKERYVCTYNSFVKWQAKQYVTM